MTAETTNEHEMKEVYRIVNTNLIKCFVVHSHKPNKPYIYGCMNKI